MAHLLLNNYNFLKYYFFILQNTQIFKIVCANTIMDTDFLFFSRLNNVKKIGSLKVEFEMWRNVLERIFAEWQIIIDSKFVIIIFTF